jgi:hypothetical protein
MKINIKDNYEDIVIKSSYMKRGSNRDMSKYLKEYQHIIKSTADIVFRKFQTNFEFTGNNFDDVLQMANIYSIYYFDNYSALENEKTRSKIEEKLGRVPTEAEIKRHDRNGLITFIRQRLGYINNIISKKDQNFSTCDKISIFLAKTNSSMDDIEERELAKNYKEYGYRRVFPKELKEIKNKNTKDWKDKDGFKVFRVEYNEQMLTPDLYETLFINDNSFYDSVEDFLLKKEEEIQLEERIENFNSKDMVNKVKSLKFFISINKNNEKNKERVNIIRRNLKKLDKDGRDVFKF